MKSQNNVSTQISSWVNTDNPSVALSTYNKLGQQNLAFTIGALARLVYDKATGNYKSARKAQLKTDRQNNPEQIAFKPKYLDRIIILGTHQEQDARRIISRAKQISRNSLVLGNGEDAIKPSEFEKIKGRIGPSTVIDVLSHGTTHQGKLYIFGVGETRQGAPTQIDEVFKLLNAQTDSAAVASKPFSTTVNLYACNSGMAQSSAKVLLPGIALITYHDRDKSVSHDMSVETLLQNLNATSPIKLYSENITFLPYVSIGGIIGNKNIKHSTNSPKMIPFGHDRVQRYLWGIITDVTKYAYDNQIPGYKSLLYDNQNRIISNQQTHAYTMNALYDRIIQGDIEKVRQFLQDSKIKPDDLSYGGNTMLTTSFAAKNNKIEMVKLIIEAGAGFSTPQKDGGLPLGVAAIGKVYPAVKLLIEHGVDVNQRDYNMGLTALHHAARQGDKNIVNLLLEKGANPFIAGNNGETARDRAKKYGKEDIAKILEQKENEWNKKIENRKPRIKYNEEEVIPVNKIVRSR